MGVTCSSQGNMGQKMRSREEFPEDDCLRLIKEKAFLDLYQNGYSEGYEDAIKKMRK